MNDMTQVDGLKTSDLAVSPQMAETASVRINRKVNEVFDEVGQTLMYLHSRWQDESQYEDFNEYELRMQAKVSMLDGITFVKATQRPFGFIAQIEGINIQFSFSGTSLKARQSK